MVANDDRVRTRPERRGVLAWVMRVAVVALVVLALATTLVPRLLGGQALTVLTGSMEPAYSPGDMVIAVPKESYALGDVVTFQSVSGDPTLITHRIVSIGADAAGPVYVTRGDTNGADDEPIIADQVMGRVIYSIPRVGYIGSITGSYRAHVIAAVAVGLIGYGIYMFGSDVLSTRRRKMKEHS